MKWMDWRKLGQDTQAAIRIHAVLLVTQAGEKAKDVIRILGITESRLYDWRSKYFRGGLQALRSQPRGGKAAKRSEEQARWVEAAVLHHTPTELGMDTPFWTRRLIAQLIEQPFGVRLSESSVGRVLHRLDMSDQKARKRALQQDREAVRRWVNETFPRSARAACRQGAVLYVEDEAGVRSTACGGRTWGRVGQTPVVSLTGKHFGVTMLSVVNAEGGLHFHLEAKSITGERFLDFLKALTKSEPRPIFLILDRHPAHHATEVIDDVASHDDPLQFHFLPVDAPEITPVELAWHDLKKHKINKRIILDPSSLRRVVNSSLRSLQRQAQKIRSFFHEKHVRYAIGAIPCNEHQRRRIPGLSSPKFARTRVGFDGWHSEKLLFSVR